MSSHIDSQTGRLILGARSGGPARGEFSGPNETLVEVTDEPDGLNRVRFVAYWLTDRGPAPDGVHGHVFYTQLDAFARRNGRYGHTTKLWPSGEVLGEPDGETVGGHVVE